MKRFYILKPDGIRFRPIGAPSLDSKIISRSINDLLYLLYQDRWATFQHGFRPRKGVHTITMELFEEIIDKGKREIFEFDLTGFFNQINNK